MVVMVLAISSGAYLPLKKAKPSSQIWDATAKLLYNFAIPLLELEFILLWDYCITVMWFCTFSNPLISTQLGI